MTLDRPTAVLWEAMTESLRDEMSPPEIAVEVKRADGHTIWVHVNDGTVSQSQFASAEGDLYSRTQRVRIGDGGTMYTCQALWTAAHDAIPVVYVIFNNASYRILKQRTLALKGFSAEDDVYVGMPVEASKRPQERAGASDRGKYRPPSVRVTAATYAGKNGLSSSERGGALVASERGAQ